MSRKDIDDEIARETLVFENTLRSFDKFLTALASAAVALSFTYYTSGQGTFDLDERIVFLVAFVLFILSLLLVISSQLTSAEMSRSKVRLLRAEQARDEDSIEYWYQRKDRCSRWTRYLNYGSYGTLVLGLSLFTALAIMK